MGFDKAGLLRQAGYEEGDRISQTIDLVSNSSSTSSTSFSALSSSDNQAITNLDVYPQDATLAARVLIESGGSMGSDADYRGRIEPEGGDPNETTPTVTIASGNTFQGAASPFTTVSTRQLSKLKLDIRSDGGNTVSVFDAAIQLVVTL